MKLGGLEDTHQGLWLAYLGREEAPSRFQWGALQERESLAVTLGQKVRPDPCYLTVVTGIFGVQGGMVGSPQNSLGGGSGGEVGMGLSPGAWRLPLGGSSGQRVWAQEVVCEGCVNGLWEPHN